MLMVMTRMSKIHIQVEKKKFRKTLKQIECTRLMAQFTFFMMYGGSRSGKTFNAIRLMIARACKVKSRHLIAREHLTAIKSSIIKDTIPKVFDICYPHLPYKINQGDYYLTLPNQSTIWFGGLGADERTDRILGNEYSTIFLNEASQLNYDSYNTVASRLAENVGLPLRLWADCNPTSVKHWTNMLYNMKCDPITGAPIKNPDDYGSIQMNPIDNLENLPEKYILILESMPERARKRFLDGLFLNDIEGALWTTEMLEMAKAKVPGEIMMTVIAVDPAVTSHEDSDLTGIVVCSRDVAGDGIVHDDLSLRASPNTWVQRIVNLYHEYEANAIVVETNQGGDIVEAIIKKVDRTIPVIQVKASKGKFARAEPIAALYEQGKISHTQQLIDLETEMTEYVPMNSKKSPDRLDAVVWGLTHLLLKEQATMQVRAL